ncbi:hypothetical protein GCM10022631_26490 [Deinococcus rubellus]|uniref:hypothetical protein n=1 Tax=Deinococcus rubellus TaxID=1889240 RepID=UPI0031E4E8A1
MTKIDPLFSAMPQDLYLPQQDAALEYSQIEQTSAEARIRRMDIVASLYVEELPKGKNGLFERIGKRLHLEEGDKRARNTLSDAWSTFRTFRLTGDQGLGYSREELIGIPISRLRAIAHNRDWALKNAAEARTLLTEKNETEILKHIQEADPNAKAKKKDNFLSRELRFTAEDAEGFDQILGVIEAKMVQSGETFSENAGIKRAQLVTFALSEWLLTPTLATDEDGNTISFSNTEFMVLDDDEDHADHAAD